MLRYLFYLLIVRPVMLIVLGFNIRGRERLIRQGPLLVVANHNSHLDALALVTLFGMRQLKNVHPVAAADYFLSSPWFAWFSVHVIGILPLDRKPKKEGKQHPLAPITEALKQDKIVIIFPEGSRGEPEQLEEFKTGIAHLAKKNPDVPVTPIFMHGFGKSLPKGEALLVPFVCDIYIGESNTWTGDRERFMEWLNGSMRQLADEAQLPPWDARDEAAGY